jgi:hypothetical protein
VLESVETDKRKMTKIPEKGRIQIANLGYGFIFGAAPEFENSGLISLPQRSCSIFNQESCLL